jgi:signal transduction histidine kinase
VFDHQPQPTLEVGDQIIQIADVTWEQFQGDLRKTFFDGFKPGDTVPIMVERGGQIIHIDWVYPLNPARAEILDQLISEWFIAYGFWVAGLLTVLLIRPRDARWLLMVFFNFLTAIWLIAGSGVSSFHIWDSALVLRMAVLLCVPVYLHLHWLYPRPLGKIPPLVIASIYAVTILVVLAQGFQLLPASFFIVGFLIALGGSFIFLLIHMVRQPSARRDLRLVFVTALLALALAVIWQTFYSLQKIPAWLGSAGLLGLPLLPLAYLYSAFRYRLGGLEARVNRFFSIYLFAMLLGIIEIPLIVLLDRVFLISAEEALISLISSTFTACAFIWGYPIFENFVEHQILGIPLPSKRVLEMYSAHITMSNSSSDLVQILRKEILPSLLIRQFAFLHNDQGSLNVLATMDVMEESLPDEQDIPFLIDHAGVYRSPDMLSGDLRYSWIRLILSLKLGEQIIGFWLFGRRDPDDLYSQQEIPMLGSLANLTAIALSNISQTERLKSVYQANINRYEQERLRLARDLHDIILNELAALPIRSDAPLFSSTFQQAYDRVSEQLREIVQDLRPAMLTFGLKLALEAFVEHLKERNQGSAEIVIDIQAEGECRYPLVVENNLYRIVQEACENSLRYARAKTLSISGSLAEQRVELRVEDDGIGLDSGLSLKFNDLQASRHYGLAGMHERASVIGADLSIRSQPDRGTQIQIIWSSKESI